MGYGLVVGLAGTGDNIKNGFTSNTLANLLIRQGISMKDKSLVSSNIASVIVTAKLPPFAKLGSKIDVQASWIGCDAKKSLQGGTLLMTPLRGADSEVYAVAQGAITLGGFAASGAAGGGVTKNHTTVGIISNGASIEKELKYEFEKNRVLSINLFQADFTTSTRLANVINNYVKDVDVQLIDSNTVTVSVKDSFRGNLVKLVSVIENLDVPVDSVAVVIINEKTGTVVMGEKVRISTVAFFPWKSEHRDQGGKKGLPTTSFRSSGFAGGFAQEMKGGVMVGSPGGTDGGDPGVEGERDRRKETSVAGSDRYHHPGGDQGPERPRCFTSGPDHHPADDQGRRCTASGFEGNIN